MKKNTITKAATKRLLSAGCALVMALSLAGCASKSADNTNAGQTTDSKTADSKSTDNKTTGNKSTGSKTTNSQTEDITLVLDWTPNTNHTGFYVALDQGFFEEEGLNVKIVQPPEDGASMMVASGQAQFGIDFQDSLAPVFSSEDEIPVTTVAALIQHNTSGIISLKEDNINSPRDLEGKNYATWGLPTEQAIMKYIVENDGGDWSKVNLIPEYVENEPAALQQNIDAIWIFYGWAGISCRQAGLDTNVIFFKDYGPQFDYYGPVIIGNNDYLASNPETAKKFLSATKKGYELAISEPDKAADILCRQVPELDEKLVKESQEWLADQYKADADQWGYIDQERWDAFYKWLYENRLSDEIPAGFGFTDEYLS